MFQSLPFLGLRTQPIELAFIVIGVLSDVFPCFIHDSCHLANESFSVCLLVS